ncbi:MAG: DUF1559 domain-containing protein [Proteobacteria bacterium]|nr:DUF1559 domain-containing protein [Pseudomonadota bacterium]
MFNKKANSRAGLSLIEVLVVIAIIGVLIALLLPAVQKAREAMIRIKGVNNFKQLGIAQQTHHDTFGWFPPNSTTAKDPATGLQYNLTWHQAILPYIEQGNLAEKRKLYSQWYAPANADVTSNCPATFVIEYMPGGSNVKGQHDVTMSAGGSTKPVKFSPKDYDVDENSQWSNWVRSSGGILDATGVGRNARTTAAQLAPDGGKCNIASCTDGTSNTLLHVINSGSTDSNLAYNARVWTNPGHGLSSGWLVVERKLQPMAVDDENASYVGMRPDGMTIVGFVDGSARAVKITDPTVLRLYSQVGSGKVKTGLD